MGAVIHLCDVEPEDLGPLLLGQLTPSRAREVARRVAACPQCSAEAADLSAVVAALRAYPPPDVVQAAVPPAPPPAAGLEDVLTGVHAERSRRHRRRTLLAAAAAVAVLGLGTAVVQLLPDDGGRAPGRGPGAVQVQLAGSDGERGRATLAARGWGTAIRLEVSGLDPAARYGVWFAEADGGRLPAGSFRPTAAGSVDLRLSAALPLDAGRVVGVSELPSGAAGRPVDVLAGRLAG